MQRGCSLGSRAATVTEAWEEAWADDIEETQGARPDYPIIGDADFSVSKLCGMLPADTSGDAKARTAADNETVRNVFVIGPDKLVKLVLMYPMTTEGEDVIIAGSVSNDEAKEIFEEWKSPKPYIRIVPQPR